MSSYIDHHVGPVPNRISSDVTHSWSRFTEARMRWLYGDAHTIERRAAQVVDLAAWERLGSGRAAA